jgi:putative ABC transport system permease protein
VNQTQYLKQELIFRRGRTIATLLSIGVSVLAAVLLISVATTYSKAVQAPMKTVGADIVAQLSGDIPRALEGLVFPHPNALLPATSVKKIAALPGVVSITRGVYLWELQPNPYKSILGIEGGAAGLDNLNANIISGAAISPTSESILIDSDYAAKNNLSAGSMLKIGNASYKISGIVDAATGGKVIRANVYMPIRIAQRLAVHAPRVQELYPFGPDDANMLLIKVDNRDLRGVVEAIRAELGKKAVVSSGLSFQETLNSVLFLSQRLGLILALVIGLFTTVFVLRATASAVNERHRDMAVLEAIGWNRRQINRQVILENVILAVLGSLAGVVLAVVIARLSGGIQISIDLPWDLSSTPHFLPGAKLDRTQIVNMPLEISSGLMAITGIGGVLVGLVSAVIATSLKRPQPWTLLCSE